VVRTSVFDWQTFPDLWLTCDHFVGKVSTMGQPTRPTQPSVPRVNEVETIKWQIIAACGCLAAKAASLCMCAGLAYSL